MFALGLNVQVHSLNVKQFYLRLIFNLFDHVRCYHSRSVRNWERCQWRGNSHFPKLQHYRSFNIGFFNVILKIIVGRGSRTTLQSIFSTAPAYPVGWGYRIHWLLLWRVVKRPMSALDMTLNNLMVRFQGCWSFGNAGYLFIVIASRSTLTGRESTLKGSYL